MYENGELEIQEEQGVKLVREFIKDMNAHDQIINVLYLLLGFVLGLLITYWGIKLAS